MSACRSTFCAGVAPQLTRLLREGRLVAPFGREWVADLGRFDLVFAAGAAGRSGIGDFVSWLRVEVDSHGQWEPAAPVAHRHPRKAPAGRKAARR